MKHELEWLVENRKSIAHEPDLDAVLYRLIRLEVDKRLRIEQQKEEKKGTSIQRR